MQDLNKIWSSCVETLEKNKIVDDKIILDSLFKPATLEEIEDNQVIITTELKWNIDAILEKQAEIESILSNSFSKPIKIKVLEVEEINEIAKLPGREGMYSMLLGMLQAPVSKFARVVKAVAEAKENGSEAVAKEDAAPVEEAASEETKVETAE